MHRRIFIAVDISDAARRVVSEYISEMRSRFPDVRIGWERPEKLHFTIKFLGHVDQERIVGVERAVAAIAAEHYAFTAETYGTGIFPNAREPRILWIGMRGGREEMVSLGTSVEKAVEHLGFVQDPRIFSPHLTIGRVREPRRGKEVAFAHIGCTLEPIEFNVDHITIYESTLGARGSTYDVVSKLPLPS